MRVGRHRFSSEISNVTQFRAVSAWNPRLTPLNEGNPWQNALQKDLWQKAARKNPPCAQPFRLSLHKATLLQLLHPDLREEYAQQCTVTAERMRDFWVGDFALVFATVAVSITEALGNVPVPAYMDNHIAVPQYEGS